MKYFFIFEPKIKLQVSSAEFNLLDKLLNESRHKHVITAGGFWHSYNSDRNFSGEANAWLSLLMHELEQILLPLVKEADTLDPVRTALHAKLSTINETALAASQKANNDIELKEV
jgi:hypothetical protein